MKPWSAIAVTATLLFLSISSVATAAATSTKHVKNDVVWPSDAIKWEEGPIKGTRVAKLWGDWLKGGPYGVLIKFDAGLMHPLHKHSQSLKIVVLSGTFVHQPEGGTETKLSPGSYLLQAAGKNHISGCAPGAECEFFMTSGDKFDLIPVEAPATEKK